jgi:hypothetical protein
LQQFSGGLRLGQNSAIRTRARTSVFTAAVQKFANVKLGNMAVIGRFRL